MLKYRRLLQLCIASLACAWAARAEVPRPSAHSDSHPLVWDAMAKKLQLPGMTNTVLITFWVTNSSTSESVISSVETDCECAIVEAKKAFPWTLAPGTGRPLNIRVNTRGRFGEVVRTVAVLTSHGPQFLTVNLSIPITPAPSNVSVRQRDVMAAKANRQALFRGSCAPCHAAPALGLSGAALFSKACGICHQAENRAEMVPDLAALERPADPAYWRRWIVSGKEGSLMPAFAHSEGGILDASQIESLVEYLIKEFPFAQSSHPAPSRSASSPADASPASYLPQGIPSSRSTQANESSP